MARSHKEFQFDARPLQAEIAASLRRFNCLVAHRRLGKTVLCLMVLIQQAWNGKNPNPRVWYYAPTYAQAARIAWDYAVNLTDGMDCVYNRSELTITFPNGARLGLGSADNPDASRGIYADAVVLDEPAQMPPRIWYEILRPAMADRPNSMMVAIGTPQGRHGLLYELWEMAETEPDWWRGMYKASETGIIDPEELAAASRTMDRAAFEQEFEVSWDAAIRGAYWNLVMSQAEAEERITTLPHDPGRTTYASFDLGMNDATAAIIFQVDGMRINVLEITEYTNTGLPDIVKDLSGRPYNWGKWIMPHDVEVRSLSTGRTRRETLQNLGVDVLVAPKVDVIDGIEAGRQLISRTWWDREKCHDGIEAMRQYRADVAETRGGVLSLKPLHDWTSHVADAWRYLAVTDHNLLSDTWGAKLDYSNRDRQRLAWRD